MEFSEAYPDDHSDEDGQSLLSSLEERALNVSPPAPRRRSKQNQKTKLGASVASGVSTRRAQDSEASRLARLNKIDLVAYRDAHDVAAKDLNVSLRRRGILEIRSMERDRKLEDNEFTFGESHWSLESPVPEHVQPKLAHDVSGPPRLTRLKASSSLRGRGLSTGATTMTSSRSNYDDIHIGDDSSLGGDCPEDRIQFIAKLAPLLKLNLPSRLDKSRSEKEFERRRRASGALMGNTDDGPSGLSWLHLQERVRGWHEKDIAKERQKCPSVITRILNFQLESGDSEPNVFGTPSSLRITPDYIRRLESGMRHVDRLLVQVDRLESAWRSTAALRKEYPGWNEERVSRRLKTLYAWRSTVRNLNRSLSRVCGVLGAGDAGRDLLANFDRVGNEPGEEAAKRLSVILWPYHSPSDSDDDNVKTQIHVEDSPKSFQVIRPDSLSVSPTQSGSASPALPCGQDVATSSLRLSTSSSSASSPVLSREAASTGKPIPLRRLQGLSNQMSSRGPGFHSPDTLTTPVTHISHYHKLHSSASCETLSLTEPKGRSALFRQFAENSMKRRGISKTLGELRKILNGVMPKAKKLLAIPAPTIHENGSSYADIVRRSPKGSIEGDLRWDSDLVYPSLSTMQETGVQMDADEGTEVQQPNSVNFVEWQKRIKHETCSAEFIRSESVPEGDTNAREEENIVEEDEDTAAFGAWGAEFNEMGLPSLLPHYVFLARVPLDVMHQCINVCLQQTSVDQLNPMSLQTLIRQCKEAVNGGVLVKNYYRRMLNRCLSNDPTAEQRILAEELDQYEDDLCKLLKLYCDCVHSLSSKVQKLNDTSYVKSTVEEEWDFIKRFCPYIRSGEAETAKRFCDLASTLLESIGLFLSKRLDACLQKMSDRLNEVDREEEEEEDADDELDYLDEDDLEVAQMPDRGTLKSTGVPHDGFLSPSSTSKSSSTGRVGKCRQIISEALKDIMEIFKETKMRMLKATDFAKMLRKDLEVAADFSLRDGCTVSDFMNCLCEGKRHILVQIRDAVSTVPPCGVECSEGTASPPPGVDGWHWTAEAETVPTYGVFVPQEMLQDPWQIRKLLHTILGQADKTADKSYDANAEYLVLVEGDIKLWKGPVLRLAPTAEHTVLMSHRAVSEVMLVARNSTHLELCRSRLSCEWSKLLATRNEQTTCHLIIAEALHDMKNLALQLGQQMQEKIKEVLDSLENACSSLTAERFPVSLTDKLVSTMQQCFPVAFTYHKELIRLSTGLEPRRLLVPVLVGLFDRWRNYVKFHQAEGRGRIPRWANDGCDFIWHLISQPSLIGLMQEEDWKTFRRNIDDIVVYIVGNSPSPSSPLAGPPAIRSRSSTSSGSGATWGSAQQQDRGRYSTLTGRRSKTASPATVLEDEEISVEPAGTPGQDTQINCERCLTPTKRKTSEPSMLDQDYKDSGTGCISGSNVPPALSRNVFSVPGFGTSVRGEAPRPRSGIDLDLAHPSLLGEFYLRSRESGRAFHSATVRALVQLKELEHNRDERLRSLNLAGRVSDRKAQDPVQFIRRAPFKWQRSGIIGAGTFGKVYSAIRWDSLERIAVKELTVKSNELLRRTVEEYELIFTLSHPSLVRYYGLEGNSTEILLFMEYCDEGTLAKLCKDMIPEMLFRRYTRNLLNGIVYLHDKVIIHRDIKTANIFLCTSTAEEGMIKLGDFGCAIRIREPTSGTMTGEFRDLIGSANYMAPEVCVADSRMGEKGYGRACDIWSFGCVILEMITGKMPWHELDSRSAIIFKVGNGHAPNIPPVGDRMTTDARGFINKCLVSHADARSTATQLLDHPFVAV